jgi:hypothetical protein
VIGFEQQDVGAAEMKTDGVGDVAEVGGDRNLDPFGAERIADGVGGVVRDGEAGDVDIADGEAGAGLKEFELRSELAPIDGGRGEAREIDGDAEFFGDGLETVGVIVMLVRDEDGGELFGRDTRGGEAFEGLLAGEASIDEEAGSLGGNESGVAGARGSQDGNFNYGDLLPIYYGSGRLFYGHESDVRGAGGRGRWILCARVRARNFHGGRYVEELRANILEASSLHFEDEDVRLVTEYGAV